MTRLSEHGIPDQITSARRRPDLSDEWRIIAPGAFHMRIETGAGSPIASIFHDAQHLAPAIASAPTMIEVIERFLDAVGGSPSPELIADANAVLRVAKQ